MLYGSVGRVGLRALSGVAFSPLSLFANGEQGVWYDPSDFSTMFQDAAGTTPVTAMEQPVGLVLDKSRGLTLGPELVTNGDFATDANWVKGTGWTISGGAANYDGTDAPNAMYQTAAVLAAGKSYRVSITVTLTQGSLLVRPSVNATAGQHQITSSGTYSILLSGQGGSFGVVAAFAGARFIGFIDNISVRELPGAHLSQSTAAARPVLSARVNLLTYTEDFSQAIWVKSFCTASAMNVADPVGGNTASTITATANSGFFYHNASSSTSTVSNSIWVRRRTGTGAIRFRTAAGGTDTDYSSSITSSWSLLTWQCTPSGSANMFVISLATSGDAIDLWHPDCRPASAGVGLPAYQRVGAATDYDTTGFPLYLKFDGTDDSLSSAAINFTSTDKMSVFAGVRKLSVDVGIIYELSGNWNTNDGSFQSASTNPGFDAASRGTAAVSGATQVASVVASVPATAVLTASHDIAGDLTAHRLNGAAAVNATGDKGSGNFGNYPFYVGHRYNAPPTTPSSLRFNGHLYSLIVRGAATDAATITATETWVNQRTKAF